jgi:hypothetical protein
MESDTTSLFLRGMPRRIVREAKSAAAREGSTLAAFVTRVLEQTLNEGRPAQGERESALDASVRWYEENRSRLLSRYRGEYVAVVDAHVVDHDADWQALAERVFRRFGVAPVFMPRVEPGEPAARLRSPRRAKP